MSQPGAGRFEPGRVIWRRALKDPVYFSREVLGVHPHPGQILWLANATRPENLLVTGNRWGKSFVQAIKILHRALFRIRSLAFAGDTRYQIVAASITQDQANIIFNTTVRLIRRNPILSALVRSIKRTPYPEICFGNGAVVTARTTQHRGQYLLGNDYDFFSFDEAAFESDPEYLINDVIMMRLADRNGMLDLISTPNGKNWFYRRMLELQKEPSRGYVQGGDTRDNPYISAQAIAQRLRSLPPDRVAQNIAGQFIDNNRTIFSNDDIDRAMTAPGLAGACAGRHYISGWDLARKKTYTVGMTFDVTEKPYRLVAFERFQNRDWADVLASVRGMQQAYHSLLVIDATGLGDVVLSELADLHPVGVIFTPHTKGELLANLLLLHNRGEVQYHAVVQNDPDNRVWSLEEEMREIMWEDNNRYDAVMAMALALWPKRSRLLFPGRGPTAARVTTL